MNHVNLVQQIYLSICFLRVEKQFSPSQLKESFIKGNKNKIDYFILILCFPKLLLKFIIIKY